MRRVVVRGLVKAFGPVAALRGFDADFDPGLTLVLGANGSGKSTLLRVLSTVLEASAGEVEYEPLGSDPQLARAELGWVSHELLGYLDLTAKENVELAARAHGIDPGEAWSKAEVRFSLERIRDRPVRTYSRGQRQRVALARALVHDPSLLLLDEPTTGLDEAGVEMVRSTVQQFAADGAVVVLVTHEPALFEQIPARHVWLERGRIG